MTGVMQRLMAVEALPRGERMARFTTEGVYSACLDPLWLRLAERGTVVGALLEREGECEDDKAAARLWREYAAPLRKAREDRMRLRTALTRYGQHDNTCALLGTLRFGKVMPCDCGFNAAKGTR